MGEIIVTALLLILAALTLQTLWAFALLTVMYGLPAWAALIAGSQVSQWGGELWQAIAVTLIAFLIGKRLMREAVALVLRVVERQPEAAA